MRIKSLFTVVRLATIIAICLLFVTCPDGPDDIMIRPPTYSVGDIGPAGGFIFHDKGFYSDGWRYLEAAPAGWSGEAQDPWIVFGYYHINTVLDLSVGTETAVGTGKANTRAMVDAMGTNRAFRYANDAIPVAFYAAKVCDDYRVRGHDGWFLPSKDELDLMRLNLHDRWVGGLSDYFYWSSSEGPGDHAPFFAWSQSFQDGFQWQYRRHITLMVRPVRAF